MDSSFPSKWVLAFVSFLNFFSQKRKKVWALQFTEKHMEPNAKGLLHLPARGVPRLYYLLAFDNILYDIKLTKLVR